MWILSKFRSETIQHFLFISACLWISIRSISIGHNFDVENPISLSFSRNFVYCFQFDYIHRRSAPEREWASEHQNGVRSLFIYISVISNDHYNAWNASNSIRQKVIELFSVSFFSLFFLWVLSFSLFAFWILCVWQEVFTLDLKARRKIALAKAYYSWVQSRRQ